MIDLNNINVSGIETYSDIYYKIAKDYAVIDDIEYIAEKYELMIRQIDALVEEKEFINLVNKYKLKYNGKTREEIFNERVEIEKMKGLDQLSAIINNPKHKQQVESIKTIFTVSGDMKKQIKTAVTGESDKSVNISVRRVKPGQPEEEGEE